MNKSKKTVSPSVNWNILCQEQGWNEQSKIQILEGFISEVGLMSSFFKYAQEVADDENNQASEFA